MDLSFGALPPINTDRLKLRPLVVEDAEALRAMTDDPAITDRIDFLPSPFTLTDAQKLITDSGDGRNCFWGVRLREEEASLIGVVGAHLRDSGEIEIGYWFAASVHGNGLATEAVQAVIERLRATVAAAFIYAECRPENTASWRLLERLGFQADGREGQRLGRKKLIHKLVE